MQVRLLCLPQTQYHPLMSMYIPKCPKCMMKCPRCQRSIPFTRKGVTTKCSCGWVNGKRDKSK